MKYRLCSLQSNMMPTPLHLTQVQLEVRQLRVRVEEGSREASALCPESKCKRGTIPPRFSCKMCVKGIMTIMSRIGYCRQLTGVPKTCPFRHQSRRHVGSRLQETSQEKTIEGWCRRRRTVHSLVVMTPALASQSLHWRAEGKCLVR